jgi:ubiquinone/menaquinone biosynthesis C-methylase UbiE
MFANQLVLDLGTVGGNFSKGSMGWYDWVVIPRLISLAMRNAELVPHRQRVVHAVEGRVLEIGIGSGLNLPFYGPAVSDVVGIDPSPELLAMAGSQGSKVKFPVTLLEGRSEQLPLDDHAVDAAVMTWTVCSVGDPIQVLHEVRRVLRPGGRLFFVEHGLAPEPNVRWWQDTLNPVWKRLAGGCQLNRKMDGLIRDGGFRIESLVTGYIRGPRPMTYLYEGCAQPA